jgi:GntR family transcriptional regulator
MRDVSAHTEVKVLQFDYVNAPAALGLETLGRSGLYQRAVRVRSRAGQPLFHITTYIPEAIGRNFSRKDLATTPLYDLMQRAKVTFHAGNQVVSATVADPKVAARLKLAVGDPLIAVKRRHFDRKGQLVEYLEMLASPSVFELQMSLAPKEL